MTPKYQVGKGLHGKWEIESLVTGDVVRSWDSEELAILETRLLNERAGEWTAEDSAAWNARVGAERA